MSLLKPKTKREHSVFWLPQNTKANKLEKRMVAPKPQCTEEWLERAKLSRERILARHGR